MEFNLLFNSILILLIVVLILFIIKSFLNIIYINKVGKKNLVLLENEYKIEAAKLKINNQKILLLDRFYNTLFNRLFKITHDFILIQKLIFNKQT